MIAKPRTWKHLMLGLVAIAAMVLSTTNVFADKVFLKDGRVIDGKVKSNDGTSLVFVEMKDGKEVQTHYLSIADEVSRVTVEEVKPAAPATTAPAATTPAKSEKPADTSKSSEPSTGKSDSAKGEKPGKAITGRPTRVAILNFGPPRSWQGEIENTVGQEIAADAWRRAVPMLEKDKVDVVVVRINSGGGYLFELYKFHDVYQKLYKPKFRTVAWVESAISCAAMSPWVIEEFYMLPEGNIGACTGWSGSLVAVKGVELEVVLRDMEEASRLAGRDPKIMRAMQIQEPLSYNEDADGNITWFQDLSGKHVVNPANQILTFTADEAVKSKFAKGKAATPEELMKVMGINEFEWAGKEATKFIDQNMRDNDKVAKRLSELETKYGLALQAARQLRGPQNKDRRMQEVGVARSALKQMKQWMSSNPNFFMTTGHSQAWFDEQERILKELSKD